MLSMKVSQKGKVFLTTLEGISLTKYKDSVGVWTIGIGATSTEIPNLNDWPMDKSITIQQAFDLLDEHLEYYEKPLNNDLTRQVTQYQFDALVSWSYNVGIGYDKSATIIKLLNAGIVNQESLYSALMMYDKPPEIIPRRRKEAILLTTGVYQDNNGIAELITADNNGKEVSRGTINVYDYIKV